MQCTPAGGDEFSALNDAEEACFALEGANKNMNQQGVSTVDIARKKTCWHEIQDASFAPQG